MTVGMLNEKINAIASTSEGRIKKFRNIYRLVAGNRLASCKPLGIQVLGELESSMFGDDEALTQEIALDSISLFLAKDGETVSVLSENAAKVARMLKCSSRTVDAETLSSSLLGDAIVESSTKECDSNINWDDDDDDEDDEEEYEEIVDEEEEEEPEEEPEKEPEKKSGKFEEEINRYYAQYCNGVIQELIKRYTALFASGYEVVKPAGVLTHDGIVRVSGTNRVVYEDSVATTNIYSIIGGNLAFTEVPARSVVNIANAIYNGYETNAGLLYFPNKMLEFAYGLCAPSGENQESLNTYTKHSKANNWKSYCSAELDKAIKMIVRKSTYGYVVKHMEDDNYKDPALVHGLNDYLKYMQSCLSLCILMSDYKIVEIDGDRDVASLKIRICDPTGGLLSKDLTRPIIETAFMGGSGKVPFSYQPRVMPEVCLVEYNHEFNHDLAQSTPLFAYKAMEVLKEQGVQIDWDNLLLGMAEDGSILRGGTGVINLLLKLIHEICAGSRAGKGVMTLNFLASALASYMATFYVDRKPDMGSLLHKLCPEMFVITGGGYSPQYDPTHEFDGLNSLLVNTPDDALKAFGTTPTWDELGDIVYMRAIKLVMGIIIARGDGRFDDPKLGGPEGIMFVVDEFKNFQNAFALLLSRAVSKVPSSVAEKAKEEMESGKMSESTYKSIYNDGAFYALSYINSLIDDLRFLSEKMDAGFNQEEITRSNILIIGQDLNNGAVDINEFADYFRNSAGSGRYRTTGGCGVKGYKMGKQSVPYNLVHFKPADAFFGRNMDSGNSVYLAQTVKESHAYGRLDDKASNFAYMSDFTEEKRQKIVKGMPGDNVYLANSCEYFKPFLILNTSGMEDDCVKGMFARCKTAGGVSKEELISDNPEPGMPGVINKGIGFEDYLIRAGISDYRDRLSKSAKVANYVVQELLGYPGTWLEFLCDMRPEWMLTIRDVADAAKGITPRMANPVTNPIFEEYVKFNPDRFGADFVSDTEASQRAMDEFFYDDSDAEDFSNEELMDEKEAERLATALGDDDAVLDEDEEFDFFDIEDGEVEETIVDGEEAVRDPETERIIALVNELKSLGVDISLENTVPEYKDSGCSEFGQEFENINFEDDIDSLDALMRTITSDVLTKFGGIDRFVSFKVIGGSLVVNGYYYRCKINNLYMSNIPYDIRRDINSGNICKLFNYSMLLQAVNLKSLEIDSASFACNYVAPQMNIQTGSISVDLFFSKLPSLQKLKISGKLFTREGYKTEAGGDTLFYKPRRSTILADASEHWLKKSTGSAWGFTKKIYSSQNCGKVVKAFGVVGGATATAITGVGYGGTKTVRAIIRGTKSLAQGIKDVLK